VKHDYQAIDAAATALGAPASVTVAIGEVIADVRRSSAGDGSPGRAAVDGRDDE